MAGGAGLGLVGSWTPATLRGRRGTFAIPTFVCCAKCGTWRSAWHAWHRWHCTQHFHYSHTTLSHTTPSDATLSHATLSEKILSQTTLSHTHTQLFHMYNFGTRNSFTHTHLLRVSFLPRLAPFSLSKKPMSFCSQSMP